MIPCKLWYVELKLRDESNGLFGNRPTIDIANPKKMNGSNETRKCLIPSIRIPPPIRMNPIIMMKLF
jgi:hypothetical protein